MCGIFFAVSTKDQRRPSLFEDGPSSNIAPFSYSVQLSEAEISAVTSKNLSAETKLTSAHKQKIENLQRLRALHLELNKWKNARNPAKAAEIEQQMTLLSVEDPDEKTGQDYNHTDSSIAKIMARGPDYAQYSEMSQKNNRFQFFSSVLSLRQPFTSQPIHIHDCVLQFNGELYNGDCIDSNDTELIAEKLSLALDSNVSREDAILTVFASLDGEFAFVLTDLQDEKVYFGKDYIGKRSLLYTVNENAFVAASVLSGHENTQETEASCIHILDLRTYDIQKVSYASIWNKHPSENAVSLECILPGTKDLDVDSQVEKLHLHLSQACAVRQHTIHPLHNSLGDVELGVLFSGGLDCTVLAGLLAENYTKDHKPATIDLITVGFENPRTGFSPDQSPDRQLSLRSWFELSKAFHGTCVTFRLVQVNVAYWEWLSHKARVLDLIYPRATEMDLSIAIAFYFACRAENGDSLTVCSDIRDMAWDDFDINSMATRVPNYTSRAKVLFSGLGADELFGGYSRHENIFNDLTESSSEALINEKYGELSASLVHDINVIYERNLGRDDRVMSSWGKELRYPYLDNGVVSFIINSIEPELKVGFEWVTQVTKKGEKRCKKFTRKVLLRRLAEKLGFPLAASEIKRAIQFGAKSAKLEVGQSKAKGTDAL